MISATQAVDLSQLRYTAAEAQFMQRMIAHHAQALEMTALLAVRTSREDMQLLGRRIHVSQADEIELMREWLNVLGVPNGDGSHSHDAGAGQQSDIFAFASDVEADQRIEIDRMSVMFEERTR